MEEKKNKKKIMFIFIPALLFLLVLFSGVGIFLYNISPVDSKSEEYIKFTVEVGWGSNKICEELKSKGLIRNDFFAKVLLKLSDRPLYAGTYKISKDMATNEILDMISNQENIENETVTITFVEGKRLTTYGKQISEVFGFTEEEILEKLSNKDYLNTLIEKYWFITTDILKEGIYYPLEGYLYPDTYEFKKNSTLEEIIDKFLVNMDSKLKTYKEEIEINSFSIHQFLTLASIVELEGVNSADRRGVAGVFYNRLNDGWSLGSDVTTYYAAKKDFSTDLTMSELNACNPYNTRGDCVNGLPIGPICSPSLSSIAASIDPEEHKYYFFVADSSKKTYFNETQSGHDETVRTLKEEGKWYTY